MKFKTTKKEVFASYKKVVKLGYCDLQYLLSYESPVAYTSGSYGWNADIYDFRNVAICTGYNPFGNICPDCEVVEKYEQEAQKIMYSNSDDKQTQLDDLLEKFIDEVCK